MSAPASAPRATGGAGQLGLWIGLAGAAYLFRGLLLPALAASLIAYLLQPLVVRLEERGVRPAVATALWFAAGITVIVVAGFAFAPAIGRQVTAFSDALPAWTERLETVAEKGRADFRLQNPRLAALLPAAEPGWAQRFVEHQKGLVTGLAAEHGEAALLVLVVPIFAFFLVANRARLRDLAIGYLAPRQIETTVAIVGEIDRILGRYLRGILAESAVVGILAAIGLWALGVPAPLLLGVVTALANPIPYLGALISFLTASAVAVASGHGASSLTGILLLFGGIRLVDDLVVIPLVLGRSVHLHPAFVIAAILAGEQTLGVLGMVLAVPTVTVVKEVVRLLLEHRRSLQRPASTSYIRYLPIGHYVC